MRASDRAYHALKHEILSGIIGSGTAFAEVEQAERLSLSRTPIREAFARLTAEGLLVALPGRGLVVSDLSRETIVELFELRLALETEAARLVARRRDRETFAALRDEFAAVPVLLEHDEDRHDYYALVERFDTAMDDALDSRFLLGAIRQLRPHLVRARRLARDNRERLLAAAEEHLTIVEAIVDGDPDLAAHATALHLKKSLRNILNSVDSAAETATPSQES